MQYDSMICIFHWGHCVNNFQYILTCLSFTGPNLRVIPSENAFSVRYIASCAPEGLSVAKIVYNDIISLYHHISSQKLSYIQPSPVGVGFAFVGLARASSISPFCVISMKLKCIKSISHFKYVLCIIKQ
jgi:hypothetical protein